MPHRVLATLSEHKVDIIGFIASCVVGGIFLWLITPPGFILGVSSYWDTQLEDIAQYISGYRAYMAAPWSLPLLRIPSLNWPHGTTVTFVDAIPVFAFAIKLVDPLLPIPHNPYGVWVLFCFALQGGSAWFLSRQVVGRNYLLAALGVALCIMMPSLSARMGHLSLQAHFILLIALGLYFRGQRLERRQTVLWTLLLVFAFYTNFYLTAMTTALMLASAADRTLRTRRLVDMSFCAIPLLAVVITVPLTLGTAFGSAVPDTGFGFYSMNLLAPVAEGHLLAMPFYEPGTAGQYEGYNYLGLGLIILTVFALVQARTKVAGEFHRFGPFLVAILILCVVYALSNEVYLSNVHLLHWQVPGSLVSLFEAFRSSGRFFWVVSYALVVFALFGLKHMSGLSRGLIVFGVLVIQLADLVPIYVDIKDSLDREPNILADIPAWKLALDGVETIHAFPKFKCPGGYAREVLPLQMVAAEGGYNLTTGFISRYGADCDAVAEEIAASDPLIAAYVFAHTHYTDDQIQSFLTPEAQCQRLEIWTVCRIQP
ncbi:DUF6311 domain-containing protein [Devosia sp. RR2S18]|uniref:DUF6311 domain-containing protein n=1 Tax=Devosia rhizosphaerae TaxID=3049774 RepID=UPI0025414599|nr:DUF6311 domain-containing protein [Devosia sp. RR2S18]WIJ24039.1 DUF6311 domain-containing protein [Devosia sp. RR2S18]